MRDGSAPTRILRVLLAGVMAVSVAGAVPAAAHAPAPAQGFEWPESVYFDAETGLFYVGNFGGAELDPAGREPDGYLSLVGAEGRVREAQWITGLRSPKGMRRHGGDLYVADAGQVVVVDVAAAAIRTTIDLDPVGAEFPNDLAVHSATGDVFVTDTGRNAVYRLPAGTLTPEVFLESPELEAPNGILVEDDRLVIAAFGADGPRSGRVLTVDLATKAVVPVAGMAPFASLDGVERLGDTYLVTDHPGGRLLQVAADGTVTELRGGMPSAADLGLRPGDRLAAIPQLRENTVRFVTVP